MERPGIDDGLLTPLRAPAGPWASIEVVAEVGSTNTVLAHAAAGGRVAAPAVLVAEHQRAGQGRAGRTWETPERAALTLSALVAPRVHAEARGWLPLLAGLACVRALRDVGVPAALKWPNDVLLPAEHDTASLGPWRKVGGVLAQAVPAANDDAVVVGIGINVTQTADELPVSRATSLALAGAPHQALDRTALLAAILTQLDDVVARWVRDDGDAHAPGPAGIPSLADEYAAASATLGSTVLVELAGGVGTVEGTAVRLTVDGALVVARDDGSTRTVAAGDVHHLRRPAT